MTAKEYLEQIRKIDTMINNKIIEKQKWFDIALNITPNMSGEKVQSSSSQQRMSDAMDKCIDVEAEIAAKIDELADVKQEIIATIEQLPEGEYDVLHKVYVQYKSFYEVASERNISHSWATSLHGKALRMLDDILRERENKENEKQTQTKTQTLW